MVLVFSVKEDGEDTPVERRVKGEARQSHFVSHLHRCLLIGGAPAAFSETASGRATSRGRHRSPDCQ